MITFVVLHQHSLAGSSSWDWYSKLLEVSLALLFHSDCLSCGLPGLQHTRKTCCAGADEMRWLSSRYYTNVVWLGPLMGFLSLVPRSFGYETRDSCTSAGTSWLLVVSFALLSHSVLLLWTAWFSVQKLLRLISLLYNIYIYMYRRLNP